jgi:dTDP-4-dehydrorhamnose reductase
LRVVITGGKGQLGLALKRALFNDEVIALSRDELDVTDAEAAAGTMSDLRPDVVVHAAAWTDTAGCEADPARAIEVNGHGTGNVAKACSAVDAPMLYVSSNEVFDGDAAEPYTEDAQTNPVNHYGRSKLEGERQAQAALERCQIVRTSWLYGPGRVSFPEKIVQAAKARGKLRLVTDEIASPTWTIDLAKAIVALLRVEEYGVFHLTNEGYCSRKEWAEEVLRLARLGHLPVEAATLAEFGAPYKKPRFSALANVRAAKLGITLRPWRQALLDHFRTVHSLAKR